MRLLISSSILVFLITFHNFSVAKDTELVSNTTISKKVEQKAPGTGTADPSSKNYCSDNGCEEPERNRCTFDKNSVPWVEQEVVDLRKGVDGATLYHHKQHYGNVLAYELPGNFFWKALGLSALFDEPQECCGACNTNCASPIKLTKFNLGSAGAKFIWIIGDGNGLTKLVSKSAAKNIRVTITHTNKMEGEAVIWADGAEYFFYDGREPKVEYELYDTTLQKWKTWFSGKVSCFTPAREVTVLNGEYTGAVPHTDLLLINASAAPTPPSP